jgi:hypothetical protein
VRLVEHRGQTHVSHFSRVAILAQEDVGALEIEVDDALCVQEMNALDDVQRNLAPPAK